MARKSIYTLKERKARQHEARLAYQRRRRAKLRAMGLNALGQPFNPRIAKTVVVAIKPAEIRQPLKSAMPGKYDYLIDEPINMGCSYAEYLARSRKKSQPLRHARLKVLKAERRARIERCGRIKIPKTKPHQFNALGWIPKPVLV